MSHAEPPSNVARTPTAALGDDPRLRPTRPKRGADTHPGAPEALQRALMRLRRHIRPEHIDCVWVFQPIRHGRRESGLIVVSTLIGGGGRRTILSLVYFAVESGGGVELRDELQQLGEASPDIVSGVVAGLAKRVERMDLAERAGEVAWQANIGGSDDRFAQLVAELAPSSDPLQGDRAHG